MSNCATCGAYLAEGEGIVCRVCEAKNTPTEPRERRRHVFTVRIGGRAKGKQQTALEEALNRCAELEALLFAFVWNRATYPLGKQLGKSEDEIADKTLETMEAAANMVDIPKVRERLLAARQRREKKGEVHTDEADKKDTEGHS